MEKVTEHIQLRQEMESHIKSKSLDETFAYFSLNVLFPLNKRWYYCENNIAADHILQYCENTLGSCQKL